MREQKTSYIEMTDVKLAKLAVLRDTQAIRAITTKNNQRLFRTAWSVLGNHSDAEDVVQQAYLKAFNSLDRYEGEASLATWLTRITLNTALDCKRALERRRAALAEQDVSMIEDHRALQKTNEGSGALPEHELVRAELARYLKAAVANLPEDFRLIFVLREMEGMSVRDTAEATGLPEATVKTRLFRARKLLRKALEPHFTDLFSDAVTFAGADCIAMTDRILQALNTP